MKTYLRQDIVRHCRHRFDGRIFWWVFIVMIIATVIYAICQPRLYEATGEVKISRIIETRNNNAVADTALSCGLDMNTVFQVLASHKMLQLVIGHLTPEDRSTFFGPYGLTDHSDEVIKRLILANRTLSIEPKAWIIAIRYRHPDRHMAAHMVDLFLREGVAYDARVRADDAIYASAYIQQRAAQTGRQVEISESAVFAYRESRLALTADELERDEQYKALAKKAEKEKGLHKMILARISEMRTSDRLATAAWSISKFPTPPREKEYLLAPLAVSMVWGSALAIITGVLAAFLFKRRVITANQEKYL